MNLTYVKVNPHPYLNKINMTSLDNYEQYEVHIASSKPFSNKQRNEIIGIGFNPAIIASSHDNIYVTELYSHYSFNKNDSVDAYNKGKEFLLNNSDTPLVIEKEVVAMQDIVNGKDVFYSEALENSELTRILKQDCKFDGIFSNTKQADIHFTLPTNAITKELAKTFNDLDVTYIRIRRSGSEHIPMEITAGGEWTSYTIQFGGEHAVQNAKYLYHLFIKTLSEVGGFANQAIIKYEIVTDFFMSGGYIGIPAIKSDRKLTSID